MKVKANETQVEISLKRIHVVVAAVVSLVVPVAVGYGSYVKALADIRAEIASEKLETEKAFAKKDDVEKFGDKLDRVLAEVSEIKGFLKHSR